MTDVVAEAAQMLEERIADIEEELTKYDTLRIEKRECEKALGKLRSSKKATPAAGRAPRPDGTPSLRSIVQDIFDASPNTNFTIAGVCNAAKKAGWTTKAHDPLSSIRTALDMLMQAGAIKRPSPGVYRKPA